MPPPTIIPSPCSPADPTDERPELARFREDRGLPSPDVFFADFDELAFGGGAPSSGRSSSSSRFEKSSKSSAGAGFAGFFLGVGFDGGPGFPVAGVLVGAGGWDPDLGSGVCARSGGGGDLRGAADAAGRAGAARAEGASF